MFSVVYTEFGFQRVVINTVLFECDEFLVVSERMGLEDSGYCV